jgi:hypothetical protein
MENMNYYNLIYHQPLMTALSRSYLRYFTPLPLQRTGWNPRLAETALFREEMMRALAYTGTYIYLEPSWFSLPTQQLISRKLEAEYELASEVSRDVAGRDIAPYRRKGGGLGKRSEAEWAESRRSPYDCGGHIK